MQQCIQYNNSNCFETNILYKTNNNFVDSGNNYILIETLNRRCFLISNIFIKFIDVFWFK